MTAQKPTWGVRRLKVCSKYLYKCHDRWSKIKVSSRSLVLGSILASCIKFFLVGVWKAMFHNTAMLYICISSLKQDTICCLCADITGASYIGTPNTEHRWGGFDRCLLGPLLSLWWCQWENPSCHQHWSCQTPCWAAHVSLHFVHKFCRFLIHKLTLFLVIDFQYSMSAV